MIVFDRKHAVWGVASLILLALAGAAFVFHASRSWQGPAGGSAVGLLLGLASALMIVFAALLGGRRSKPSWRLGSMAGWMRAHIWLGALSLPVAALHAGFHWGGLFEMLLWAVFLVVWVSGVVGLALQHILPRWITVEAPLETFLEQIDFQCERAVFLWDKQIADLCGRLEVGEPRLMPTFTALAEFGKSATKENKADWIHQAPAPQRGLLLRLAQRAKELKWIRHEDDFPGLLPKIYAALAKDEPAEAAAPSHGAARPQTVPKQQPVAEPSAEAPVAKEKAVSAADVLAKARGAGAVKKVVKEPKETGGAEEPAPPAPAKKGAAVEDILARARSVGAAKKKSEAATSAKAMSASTEAAADSAMPPNQTVEPKPEIDAASGEAPGLAPVKKKAAVDDILARARMAGAAKKKSGDESSAKPTDVPAAAAAPESSTIQADEKPSPPASGDVAPAETPARTKPSAADILAQARAAGAAKKSSEKAPATPKISDPAAAPAANAPVEPPPAPAKPSVQDIMAQARAAAARKREDNSAAEASPEPSPAKPSAQDILAQARAAAAKKRADNPAAAPIAEPTSPTPKARPSASPPARSGPVSVASLSHAKELKRFYQEVARPYLGPESTQRTALADAPLARRLFADLHAVSPGALRPVVEELSAACDERRQWETQRRLWRWLHYWLFFHIPASFALLVLLAVHIVMALRVIPWP